MALHTPHSLFVFPGTLTLSLVSTLSLTSLSAQTCADLVRDINAVGTPFASNPTASRAGGPGGTSAPSGYVQCGTFWYFTASLPASGRELWKTDGTAAGTAMVRDLRPGTGSGLDERNAQIMCCNGLVYFRANDGVTGDELWCTDGTAAGTRQLRDLNAGPRSSSPGNFSCFGNKLYYTALEPRVGRELFMTDGTFNGTLLVRDLVPGSGSSSPSSLLEHNGRLFFAATTPGAGTELWQSDGQRNGTTIQVRDIAAGSASSRPTQLHSHRGKILFVADGGNGPELWSSDGTAGGTIEIRDIHPAAGSQISLAMRDAVIGNDLFFRADDGTHGWELWKTDGTTAGTVMVKDQNPGSQGSSLGDFVVVGNRLFFSARTNVIGTELHVSDGTVAGTGLVKEIRPGNGAASPRFGIAFGGKYYFSADDGSGPELWSSDGTSAGTQKVVDLSSKTTGGTPTDLTIVSPTRFFLGAATDESGRELFESDGTAAGTKVLADLNPGGVTGSSGASPLVRAVDGQSMTFFADNGILGTELWATDGTAAGTNLLLDINPGSFGSLPGWIASFWLRGKSVTLFNATSPGRGRELWIRDAAGTRLLADQAPGSANSDPNRFTFVRGKAVYFSRIGSQTELYVTDGTTGGTGLLKDVRPGRGNSFPREPVSCGDRMFFVANDGTHGHELWVTDGLTANTRLVKDINPGTASSLPTDVTKVGNRVVFGAQGPEGIELWISDGTAAGTQLVKDIHPGAGSSRPMHFAAIGNTVYFSANDGSTGNELWRSDLTAAGTGLVKDLVPGPGGSSPRDSFASEGKVFFTAEDANGRELWSSDGTAAGTRGYDLNPGRSGSFPFAMFSASNGIYFGATRNGIGAELWFSDGTTAGTRLVCDLNAGPNNSSPRNFTPFRGSIYCNAATARDGFEPRRLTIASATTHRLGEGSAPTYSSVASSNPILGGVAKHRYVRGPAGHLGLFVVSVPVAPYSLAGLFEADTALFVDLSSMVLVSNVPPGEGTANLPIPNDLGLLGGIVNTQILWTKTGSIFPVATTNGVELTIGR